MVKGIYDIAKDENGAKLLLKKEMGDDYWGIYDISLYLSVEENLGSILVERSYVAAFDEQGCFLGLYMESSGNYDSCETYMREVCTFLLLIGAHSYVLFHNHPNEELDASEDDKNVVWYFKAATNSLRINLDDSIVITKDGYFSIGNNKITEFESEDILGIKILKEKL